METKRKMESAGRKRSRTDGSPGSSSAPDDAAPGEELIPMEVAASGASSSAAPVSDTPVQVKKTRMSREASNLGITANQSRFMAPTLTPQTPETPQEEMRIAISIRNKALRALGVQWAWKAPTPQYMAEEVEVQELSHSIRMDRRAAVRYIFCGVYGMPPREEWQLEGGKTLVSEIATRLSISIGNRGLIIDVMLECLKHGAEFEIAARLSLRGRTNLIEELSTQAEVIYGAVESGQGIQQATVLLNQYRKALPEPEAAVSWSCVRCFISSSPVIRSHRRQSKKGGNFEKGSPWAQGRWQFAKQFLAQLKQGEIDPDGAVEGYPDAPAIPINSIFFNDEHHRQVILGCASVREYAIYRDAGGKAAISPEDWKPRWKPKTTSKYPGEARVGAMVAAVKHPDGSVTGERGELFSYTEQRLVSIADYDTAVATELRRVKDMKGAPWNDKKEGSANRYLDRYGAADWEEKVRKVLSSKIVCIREYIDHVIREGDRVFAGTAAAGRWFIFHDGLTIWFSAGAQAYLTACGFERRQVRAYGQTNANTLYSRTLPGNSPEWMRGLDAFGFADLTRAVLYHVALTSCLEVGDPLKFKMGTPAEVLQTLMLCWAIAPSGPRIVEDISALVRVLEKIVENEGACLLDEFYRSGRREMSMFGQRELTSRPRTHSRIATLAPLAVHVSVAHVPDMYKPSPHELDVSLQAFEAADAEGEPMGEAIGE